MTSLRAVGAILSPSLRVFASLREPGFFLTQRREDAKKSVATALASFLQPRFHVPFAGIMASFPVPTCQTRLGKPLLPGAETRLSATLNILNLFPVAAAR